MEKLIAFLQERRDGYWELLATAAGRMDSVSRCMDGLTAEALDAHSIGRAVSPSIVQQRVDSLAAFDAKLVIEVSRKWRQPDQVSTDLMDEAADFWACAWSAALRFLKKYGVPVQMGSSLPRLIHSEREILWEAPPTSIRSIHDLLAFVSDSSRGYDNYRVLDRAPFHLERALTEEEMVRLLGGSIAPNDSDLERLRVFLPRVNLIGPSAQVYLGELLRTRWFALVGPPSTTGGLLTLLNVVLAQDGQQEPPTDIVEHFVEILRRSGQPGPWAPFAYLLLKQGWEVP
jgi:hypothetical protein